MPPASSHALPRESTTAMFIPYSTERELDHVPYATIGLVGVNVVVFAVQMAVPGVTEALASNPEAFHWCQTSPLLSVKVRVIVDVVGHRIYSLHRSRGGIQCQPSARFI
jgi:hypothetical protein